MRDLFERARPLASAKAVAFVSTEQPYIDTLTLEQALLPNAMLAYEMDGEPLLREPSGLSAAWVVHQIGAAGERCAVRSTVPADPALDAVELLAPLLDSLLGAVE